MPQNPEIPFALDMQALIDRAQQGDETALPELQAMLDQNPEIWQKCGDLAQHAELSYLNLVAGNNLMARESILRKLTELRADLVDCTPSPLDNLLVQRVALCWLAVHHGDLDAISARAKDKGETTLSLHAQRRLDSAQRRYLQAIRTLATVRKLVRPAVSPIQIATKLGSGRAGKSKNRLPKRAWESA